MFKDIYPKIINFIKNTFKSDVFYYGLLILFGLVILLQSPLSLLSNNSSGVDSSVFLYVGKAISHGQVPYLNIFDHKGPVLYLIDYLGTTLGGPHGVWFIEFILLSVALIFSYKTVRLLSDHIPSFFSVISVFSLLFFYFEQGNLVEEYSLPFIMISLYLFTKSILDKQNLNKPALVIIGLCCAVVALLRPNMIALWVAFCFVIFIEKLIKKEFKVLVEYALYFFAGLLIVLVPTLIYFLIHSSLSQMFNTYLLFNLKYAKAMPGDRVGAAKVFSNNIFFQISLIFLVVVSTLYKKTARENNVLYIAMFLFFLISFVAVITSGMNYLHYGMTLIPCYLLPTTLFINSLYLSYTRITKNPLLVFLVFATAYIIIFNNQLITLKKNIFSTRTNRVNQNLVEIIKSNSKINDKISVTGNMVSLYLYADRDSVSKYIYQDPISSVDPGIVSGYLSDIENLKPTLIVTAIDNNKTDYSAPYAKGLQKILKDSYLPVGASDGIIVYKRVESIK